MSSNKTVVKGIRASQEFFDKCDLVAKAEGVDRNKLIVRVVNKYIDDLFEYSKEIVENWERIIQETEFVFLDLPTKQYCKGRIDVKDKR